MKTFIFTIVVLISACSLSVKNAKVPVGYQPCRSDLDCQPKNYYCDTDMMKQVKQPFIWSPCQSSHYYCGFVGVDSVAVCRYR